jgi:hypothetical protein
MIRFDFLDFFGPQMVFIGEWGTKFIFRFFLTQMIKNDQICIQTAEFIFKRSNLNSNRPISS